MGDISGLLVETWVERWDFVTGIASVSKRDVRCGLIVSSQEITRKAPMSDSHVTQVMTHFSIAIMWFDGKVTRATGNVRDTTQSLLDGEVVLINGGFAGLLRCRLLFPTRARCVSLGVGSVACPSATRDPL